MRLEAAMSIEKTLDYQEVRHPTDSFQRELRDIAKRHGLAGLVFIQFDLKEMRVGCRSWGHNTEMMRAMDNIGTHVLEDIVAGRHDPLECIPAEGRA
jgi:hypothetical protein